ncbi:MAG: class I poly(R)-hydroxyalkanoic acid synthase [Burkholderiaceae bacterium]|nr:class I poly(R)-hydroxyalkanoic acid synthase [Burkholderiaceae bacterium]
MPSVTVPADKLALIQGEFARTWTQLALLARQGALQPPHDRRFSSPAWAECQRSLLTAHAYLLSAKALEQMADAADVSAAERKRLQFSIMQWIEAVSPANYMATNPDVMRTLIESQGQSLSQGMQYFFQDLQKGRMTQTDESKFQVGQNVATTAGSVVFQNTFMQVIQYAPLTDTVHKKPLLLVPPCINKYYILDLQPENSFVRYAVAQGFTVFLISWRNPLPEDDDGIQHATWGDYLNNGVLQAIDVVRGISKEQKINALGFCVGGTLLSSALALAQARGDQPVESLTLLTTLLDFKETGVLDVFVDEKHAQTRDRQLGEGGLMSARELGTTFSFLRPNELVWNYVVNNYLKGMAPPAFDLLYWNSDGTNLPGPFFAWYFRNTYLENRLVKPGSVVVDGQPIDLGALSMPTYIYGSREDHIVPWHAAYKSTRIVNGHVRFVLGASGHIAGVINSPAKQRRNYWTYDDTQYQVGQQYPQDPESWLDGAQSHPGSWWPDWSGWLAQQSGPLVKSQAALGSTDYPVREAAPGNYVKVRAV